MAFLVDLARGRRSSIGLSATLGRDPSNTIALGDPSISRKHATVCRTPEGRFLLVDLGSTCGTFVAGRRVSEVVLNDGDEIRIGAARLRFENPGTGDFLGEDVRLSSTALSPQIHQRLPIVPDPPFAAAAAKHLDELRRDHDRLGAAMELTRAIGVEHDMHDLLERILLTSLQFLRADRGAILLVDPDTGQPGLRIARSSDGGRENVVLSSSLIAEVMQHKQGIISADAASDDRFIGSQSILVQGIRSAMCVPLLYQDELLGVLHLDSRSQAGVFAERDLEVFSSIASGAGLAIKNAMLVSRVQSAMAEELRRLDRVIRRLPEGVLLLGAGGKIVLANPLAEVYLPLLTPERKGDVLTRLGTASLAEILAHDAARPMDVVVPGPPRRTFSISGASWQEQGSDVETVVLVRDASSEREQEQRVLRQERLALVGQLAGGIAHDFNNLLAVVAACAGSLAADAVDRDQRESAEDILGAATRAADLVRQILTFSRTSPEKTGVVLLAPLIAGMQRLLGRAMGAKTRLEAHLAEALWPIRADAGQLEQAIMNLVVNARDAMPHGGAISIEAHNVEVSAASTPPLPGLAPGRYVRCSVSDTGVGMTPEVAARAFEPFFTTKEAGKGTGLGLASVQRILDRVGGAVGLRSSPGAGTTFSLYLPAAD